ncbi:hypothetical protein TSAR_000661 [Trichomalopsis sarcophagae]|uniref:RING-type E3 ubiquitin transferase n=1 Tax=Trichomalopsis sarcophagae TaxID=543379 RepID=A0A232EUS0_9HYME|nr:hypothetical protein TSAR_000661 [Trichomalopsis sarcophagae]
MATYLKRPSKLFERLAAVSSKNSSSNSSSSEEPQRQQPQLRELICPVCRSLLREPVTLPCAHNLCLSCLRGTVEHSSLSCPLCRQRVGSWLRTATNRQDSLVNDELWQLIRRTFPEELGLAHDAPDLDLAAAPLPLAFRDYYPAKKQISAPGEIRREYEVQLQMVEEEMRRQREKDRLASEAIIRKIQQEEEQQKLVQLAQDQLLAKTLAKREVIDKTNDKPQRSAKSTTVVNSDRSNINVNTNANQSKPGSNQKMSVKSKEQNDSRKLNAALISKIRKHSSTVKSSAANSQKDSTETFSSQKPVPIHNAVTRVVTHQSRGSQPNSTIFQALGEVVATTSKIFGLQSKEELHVPSDVLSSNKKKLGVEVCVTTVEGEERIGSAESAGSHDSINQEIHHFKPIKALPRTPLRTTSDGRQVDPKLIRVVPKLKRISNAVPKPPTPTHLKKAFSCSWSAFKKITKQQQTSKKNSSNVQQQQETKKTERKGDHSRVASKSRKSLQVLERNSEVDFDSNKNYTKNVGKIVNGTKVSKKLNLDEQPNERTIKQQSRRTGKKNGQLRSNKHKSKKEPIELVELDDEEDEQQEQQSTNRIPTPDPLELAPKQQEQSRPDSPVFEMTIMENIAERIKRRKTTRTASNTENVQCAMNLVAPAVTKAKSKKTSTKIRKQTKTKKPAATVVKQKPKVEKVTSVTSQIKKLAARSAKRPRYTEDTESEDEDRIIDQQRQSQLSEEQRQLEENEGAELDKSNLDRSPTPPALPSPPKKSRKSAKTTTKSRGKSKSKSKSKKQSKAAEPVLPAPSPTLLESSLNVSEEIDDDAALQEQARLERLAAQEREDRELALKLQAEFTALERVAGRTRRGSARAPSPLIETNNEEHKSKKDSNEKRPRKRAVFK